LLQAQQQQSGAADDDDYSFGAPAAAAYKSHSSNIVDVLEDMKEKAEEELSSLRKAETNAKNKRSPFPREEVKCRAKASGPAETEKA